MMTAVPVPGRARRPDSDLLMLGALFGGADAAEKIGAFRVHIRLRDVAGGLRQDEHELALVFAGGRDLLPGILLDVVDAQLLHGDAGPLVHNDAVAAADLMAVALHEFAAAPGEAGGIKGDDQQHAGAHQRAGAAGADDDDGDDETGNGGYLGDPESKPSKKK